MIGETWEARRRAGFATLVGLALAVKLGACSGGPSELPRDDGPAELPRLILLKPGTSVAGPVPAGWTARVIRSVPRVATGAVEGVSESTRRTASLFRTTVLVEVVAGSRGYSLRRVGVGNAVPSGDAEVIVTREGPHQVRESLGTLGRIVANSAYDQLGRGRIVARTETFALYRTPAKLNLDGEHVEVEMNYAILVDPESGATRTLTWSARDGTPPPRSAVVLPPDATFDCALDVAVTARVGSVPLSHSFAMAAPPPGRPVEIPAPTSGLIAAASAGKVDPTALERSLRLLLPGR